MFFTALFIGQCSGKPSNMNKLSCGMGYFDSFSSHFSTGGESAEESPMKRSGLTCVSVSFSSATPNQQLAHKRAAADIGEDNA